MLISAIAQFEQDFIVGRTMEDLKAARACSMQYQIDIHH